MYSLLILLILAFAIYCYPLIILSIVAIIGLPFLYFSIVENRGKSKKEEEYAAYINDYVFYDSITQKIASKYPHLSEEETLLVMHALRDYFWMCMKAGKRPVAMPSQVVDDAWHEFILFTRDYKSFCGKAMGRFLHHTPAEAMKTKKHATKNIKSAWQLACKKEKIRARSPNKLPLIFAIDAKLKIPNGFMYTVDCTHNKSTTTPDSYCASHIASSHIASSRNPRLHGAAWHGRAPKRKSHRNNKDDEGCDGGCEAGCDGD